MRRAPPYVLGTASRRTPFCASSSSKVPPDANPLALSAPGPVLTPGLCDLLHRLRTGDRLRPRRRSERPLRAATDVVAGYRRNAYHGDLPASAPSIGLEVGRLAVADPSLAGAAALRRHRLRHRLDKWPRTRPQPRVPEPRAPSHRPSHLVRCRGSAHGRADRHYRNFKHLQRPGRRDRLARLSGARTVPRHQR